MTDSFNVISHGDLNHKNVLWRDNAPVLIDWEAAAYNHTYGMFNVNWMDVLYKGFSKLLGWLDYSFKRSLMLECNDEAEQQMGTEHVFHHIKASLYYFDMIP